jgi:sugar/nucleoside kinase (ribokinase family)
VALRLARLGWRTGLAAVVGDDALGEALAARVAARGVSTALLWKAPPRTGLCFMEHAGKGTRVVTYRSAGEEWPALDAGWRARALLLTGLVPSPEQDARFGAAAAEGRRRGALVVVDLNARPRLWQGRGGAPAWIAEADVVKGSEEDLAALGLDARALRAAMGPSSVLVVTDGPRAAWAFAPFGEVRVAPRAVKGAGRAIGAGDAFTAGVLDVLLREEEDGATRWARALYRGHALARARVLGR